MNILKTRRGKLRSKLESFLHASPKEIDYILTVVDEYEKDNLATINKLMRKKIVILKNINGAIKSFLHAHPVFTKELTGSLSKRIYGSLLEPPKVKKTLWQKFFKKWN